MNPFDFINCISNERDIKFTREEIEEFYNPFLTMTILSRFEDSIFIVNEINSFKKPLGKYEHFLFLHSILRKRKRFSKGSKKDEAEEKKISLVMEYYECNREKAKDALKLLKKDDLKKINNYLNNKGGVQ